MTDDELTEIAIRLEEAADSDVAKSRMGRTNPGFLLLQANRDACILVAAAMLHAASSPANRQHSGDRLLEYCQIEENKTDCALRIIDKVEFAPESNKVKRDSRPGIGDRVFLLGCAVVSAATAFLLISGILFWVRLIGG